MPGSTSKRGAENAPAALGSAQRSVGHKVGVLLTQFASVVTCIVKVRPLCRRHAHLQQGRRLLVLVLVSFPPPRRTQLQPQRTAILVHPFRRSFVRSEVRDDLVAQAAPSALLPHLQVWTRRADKVQDNFSSLGQCRVPALGNVESLLFIVVMNLAQTNVPLLALVLGVHQQEHLQHCSVVCLRQLQDIVSVRPVRVEDVEPTESESDLRDLRIALHAIEDAAEVHWGVDSVVKQLLGHVWPRQPTVRLHFHEQNTELVTVEVRALEFRQNKGEDFGCGAEGAHGGHARDEAAHLGQRPAADGLHCQPDRLEPDKVEGEDTAAFWRLPQRAAKAIAGPVDLWPAPLLPVKVVCCGRQPLLLAVDLLLVSESSEPQSDNGVKGPAEVESVPPSGSVGVEGAEHTQLLFYSVLVGDRELSCDLDEVVEVHDPRHEQGHDLRLQRFVGEQIKQLLALSSGHAVARHPHLDDRHLVRGVAGQPDNVEQLLQELCLHDVLLQAHLGCWNVVQIQSASLWHRPQPLAVRRQLGSTTVEGD
mmetsp:Transcript_29893/g.69113  ORF Transcript_29893/g.69113 Transcript_29893/m.69113 type:complete len:534 (-) Transcript_29893:2206-3807(-)